MKSLFLAAVAVLTLHVASPRTIEAAAGEETDGETARIVRGRIARAGQFPWMAALYRDGQFLCTASIISNRTVLTAAHCVQNNNDIPSAIRYYAVANVDRIAVTYRMTFEDVIPHPDFGKPNRVDNDIAVLRTSRDIPYIENQVERICIARPDTAMDEYENATIMGWGLVSSFAQFPPIRMLYAEQVIPTNDNCRRGSLDENKMCTEGENRGGIIIPRPSVCSGDSGGPLVHLSGDKPPVEIGITSYGFILCDVNIPDVFTRVSKYYDFIKEHADGDDICEV